MEYIFTLKDLQAFLMWANFCHFRILSGLWVPPKGWLCLHLAGKQMFLKSTEESFVKALKRTLPLWFVLWNHNGEHILFYNRNLPARMCKQDKGILNIILISSTMHQNLINVFFTVTLQKRQQKFKIYALTIIAYKNSK